MRSFDSSVSDTVMCLIFSFDAVRRCLTFFDTFIRSSTTSSIFFDLLVFFDHHLASLRSTSNIPIHLRLYTHSLTSFDDALPSIAHLLSHSHRHLRCSPMFFGVLRYSLTCCILRTRCTDPSADHSACFDRAHLIGNHRTCFIVHP